MYGLDLLHAALWNWDAGHTGEHGEQPSAGPTGTIDERRLDDRPCERETLQVCIGPTLAQLIAAVRVLVRTES